MQDQIVHHANVHRMTNREPFKARINLYNTEAYNRLVTVYYTFKWQINNSVVCLIYYKSENKFEL